MSSEGNKPTVPTLGSSSTPKRGRFDKRPSPHSNPTNTLAPPQHDSPAPVRVDPNPTKKPKTQKPVARKQLLDPPPPLQDIDPNDLESVERYMGFAEFNSTKVTPTHILILSCNYLGKEG